jgi:catechol 2,3-dioxygenase-like lactoylglutathione lyase family enzyme
MLKTLVCCLTLISWSAPLMAEETSDQTVTVTPPAASFWHLGLVVRDIELMHRFYSGIIGLEAVTHLYVEDQGVAVSREDSIRVAKLDSLMGIDKSMMEIRHYSDPTHTQFGNHRYAFIQDPEGNLVELTEPGTNNVQ